MWIRSKNKKELVYIKRFRNPVDGAIIGYAEDGTFVDLGTYSTEAKALKVLDMIQNFIDGEAYSEVFVMPSDEEVKL